MKRYAAAIEVDICQRYPGHDLRYLWQTRQWRLLINLIEHLPYDSHLREAQLNDPWYVQALVEAKAEQAGVEAPARGVPVSEWSQEVAILSQLGSDVRALTAVVQSALGAKARPKPYDGPITVVGKAERASRQEKHESLANRMLAKRKG